MPDFKITRDPLPTQAPRVRWPFNTMSVGDCAVFESDADFQRINRAAHQVGMNHGKKFTVRRCNDQRIRVWRLPDVAPVASSDAPKRTLQNPQPEMSLREELEIMARLRAAPPREN